MSRKKKFDDLMEAITFAEAGETETARRVASQVFPDSAAAQSERILSVGGPAGFSHRMIEQSVAMAARLHYGLIALTVPPAMKRLAARLAARRPERAWQSAETFRARAAERGVPFVHTVESGEPEQAVVLVRRKFRRIAFVVIEPDLAPKARFVCVGVPIFYVVDR